MYLFKLIYDSIINDKKLVEKSAVLKKTIIKSEEVITSVSERIQVPKEIRGPVLIKKFALIYGINNYNNEINTPSLRFCINDVIAWYEILDSIGYEIYVLTDPHNIGYLKKQLKNNIDISVATKKNICEKMWYIYNKIITQQNTTNDYTNYKFVFISSGHGYKFNPNDKKDNRVFLYLYNDLTDDNVQISKTDIDLDIKNVKEQTKHKDRDDIIRDSELTMEFSKFLNRNVFIASINDNCYSGGLYDDVLLYNSRWYKDFYNGRGKGLITLITASGVNGKGYELTKKNMVH